MKTKGPSSAIDLYDDALLPDPDVPDPPTHVTNLRAEYTMGRLEFASHLNNVFNSHPLLGAFQDTPTSNLITHGTLRPRTLGVSLNYAF
jgi:outer membrane receptor protein involved in Fe transport